MARTLTILGLETSCDETAAAVVRARIVAGRAEGPGEILASEVFGQVALHAVYGGVVPEIAARAHAERADIAIEAALARAGVGLGGLDAVAVTAGPGLIGGLLAGVLTAEGLAAAAGLPLFAINHLEGHALTPRLSHGIGYPYLLLLVSGGHCQLVAVEALGRYRRLGGTIDDAAGEAFDKVAKLLGLGFPGGPEIERAAGGGDPARFALPRPLLDRPGLDMSFSGLKTAVLRAVERLGGPDRLGPRDVADLAASFEAAVAEVLAEKTARALAHVRAAHPGVDAPVLAVAGGVAANARLRAALTGTAAAVGARLVAPPLRLCGDNGAMIAWAAAERIGAGLVPAPPCARPRWPLDETAPPMLGGGRRGAKA